MADTEYIGIRCSLEFKDFVDCFLKKYNVEKSFFIKEAILNFMDNIDELKDTSKLKQLRKSHNFKIQKAILIRRQEQRYFIRNFYKSLFRLCMSHKLNNGKINYNSICSYIDEALILFDTLDSDIKKDLNEDIEVIKELKNPTRLNQKVENYAFFVLNNNMSLLESKRDDKNE